MDQKNIIKQCHQIMELWNEGYTDREVAVHLELTPIQFQTRIAKIQKDGIYGLDTALLFEKNHARLMKIWRKAWGDANDSDVDPRLVAGLLRVASDVASKIVDMSFKLGITSPEIIVKSVHEAERKKYKDATNQELFEMYQEQIAKWN